MSSDSLEWLTFFSSSMIDSNLFMTCSFMMTLEVLAAIAISFLKGNRVS